jgi:hypothetical protein
MTVKAPVGLGARGRRMWTESLEMWDLTPPHRILLEEACRIADRLELLNKQIREVSSEFAACAPILSESRQQSMALQRMFAEIRQGARPVSVPQQGGSGVLSLAGKIAERRAQAQG